MLPKVMFAEGAATAAEDKGADPAAASTVEEGSAAGEVSQSDLAAVLEALRQGTSQEGDPEGEDQISEGEGEEGGEPVVPVQPRRDPDHFLKAQLRNQNKLIQKLQRDIEQIQRPAAAKPPESAARLALPKITVDEMTDPDKFAEYLERRDQAILEQAEKGASQTLGSLREEFNPTVEESKANRAMRFVYGETPMGGSLLANPTVLQFIQDQSSDPSVVESLKDPYRTRTEALLFRFLTRLHDAQRSVRSAAAKPQVRKENRGMSGPKSGGGGPSKPPAGGETVREKISKMSPDAAWDAMRKAAKTIGAI